MNESNSQPLNPTSLLVAKEDGVHLVLDYKLPDDLNQLQQCALARMLPLALAINEHELRSVTPKEIEAMMELPDSAIQEAAGLALYPIKK